MVDVMVRCDKPYDLDAADKRRGKPRRRRKDSKTTAYELNIRLDQEQRGLMNGKRKYTRVVYAKNKKEDLASQMRDFESDVSAKLRAAALQAGCTVKGADASVSGVVRSYLESREKVVVSKYTEEGLALAERYIDPTIGHIAFRDLTVGDIEAALERIPEISRKLNEEARERQAAARAAKGPGARRYPEFHEIRVAGLPSQHKVLVLLRLAGNWAVDHELVFRNVANSRRLASQYPKNKPQIDPFTEDEAKLVYSKIQELPLSAKKVEFQLLFMCGLRPCELLALTFDNVNFRNPEQGVLHVVKNLKTENASRNIPLDPGTTALLRDWKQSRVEFAEAAGVSFSDSWLICCDDGQKVVYNTLKQRWWYFLRRCGLEHRRAYAMRHTFATMAGRNNVDVKTVAELMGHADAGFTLRVYAGFLESRSMPVLPEYGEFLNGDGGCEPA